MIEGNCKASESLEPGDVYFFDDLDHPDLQDNLGQNYYKVPAYTFKASIDRIAGIYRDAIKDINSKVLISTLNKNKYKFNINTSINGIINTFKKWTKGTTTNNSLPPLGKDDGISMMEEAIHRVSGVSDSSRISDISRVNDSSGGKRNYRKTYKKKVRGWCCFSRRGLNTKKKLK